ncbi:anti-sigma factor [Bacteroidia bacterium]|nr:anti-sigma factor [Bacteroidia bacterium]
MELNLQKYLRGESTKEEKKQILEWVQADPANRDKLLALRKLHDITLWQTPIDENLNRKILKSRRSLLYQVASIAAVIVMLVIGGSIIMYNKVQQQMPDLAMQTVHVPSGQHIELVLADGTSVWLNAGSTFTFPNNFGADNREVTLDGEGYFEVSKDAKKPFIVNTSSHKVAVLGTKFDVMAYSNSKLFEVSLLEGSVEVYADGSKDRMRLEPQTKVYLADNNRLVVEQIVNYDYLQWKEGLICFNDEPVVTMLSKLELYYDVKIVVENDSFNNRRYTGKFRTKDGIEHILKVFQLKDKFTYFKDDDKNIITIK